VNGGSKMKTTSRLIAALLGAGVVLGSSLSTSAQTFYLNPIPEEDPTLGLRYLHANLQGNLEQTTFSGTYDFYLEIPLSDGLGFDFSLPYSRVSYFPGPDQFGMPRLKVEQSALGNVYFGMHFTNKLSEHTKSVLSMGIHFPSASDNYNSLEAVSYGMLANLHQMRRSLPDAWIVYWNMVWRIETSAGSILGFEFGPEAWIPEGGVHGNEELLCHYGFSVGAGTSHFTILTEIMGLCMATEDFEDFGDRFDHHLAFGIGVRNYFIRPSLWYQIPFDDDTREVLEGVIGFQIEISLPKEGP